jgi:8-oxo-dGTP diphosphatase
MKGLDPAVHAHTIIVVFCYILKDDRILLIERGREPYRGDLTIPGGKKEKGETFVNACKREIKEECGLDLGSVCLAGMVNNFSPDPLSEVLSLYFVTDDFCGETKASSEGSILWYKIEDSFNLPNISPFYRIISPWVLEAEGRVFHGHVRVDNGGSIIDSRLEYF